MDNQPVETVIAGSKAFALALLAPITARIGMRPRIAADLAQALKVGGGSALIVVEFQGDDSLEAIRQLLQQAAGLAVVAAVPAAHAGAEEGLRALGVDAVRWDGKPEGVLSAVARRVGATPVAHSAAPRPSAAPPAPIGPAAAVPAPTPTAPAAAAPATGVGALFDDIPIDDDIAVDGEVSVASGTDAALPLASIPAGGGAWPSNVPRPVEAAEALDRGLQGLFEPPGTPLAVVADVLAGISPLERAVLTGEPVAVDSEPIRIAAVMRVRVAVALATAPPAPGAPTDAAAVSALLAEIDALLSEVNALVAGAPPELVASLEQVRNALVKEAIDFSEAAHRAQPGDAASAAAPAGIATAAARKAAQTRIIAVASKAELEIEKAQQKRQVWMYVVLVLAALGTGAFHAWRYAQNRAHLADSARPTRAGAPTTAIVEKPPGENVPVVIRSKDGNAFTAEELSRIREEESLRGHTIQEAMPGMVIVQPRRADGVQAAPALGR